MSIAKEVVGALLGFPVVANPFGMAAIAQAKAMHENAISRLDHQLCKAEECGGIVIDPHSKVEN